MDAATKEMVIKWTKEAYKHLTNPTTTPSLRALCWRFLKQSK